MKKLFLLTTFLIFTSAYSQSKYSKDALRLCSVLQSNNFGTDSDAENALDKILNVIGASKRFVLQPCSNINNAVATSFKGIRYILYDREFMNSINYGNNWGNIFVLAHEVGHHINGHSLDLVLYAADAIEPQSLAQSRQDELEADEFAGFILAKLGGALSAAEQSIYSISSNRDDTYSTHPSRDKRLAAVKNGFSKASSSSPNNYLQLFKRGVDEYNKKTPQSIENSIKIFKTVVSINSNFLEAYWYLFLSHYTINKYKESLGYLDTMIVLSPNDSDLYTARGKVYYNDLGHTELAKRNFEKAVALNDKSSEAMFYLGGIYGNQGNLSIACNYLTNSCKLGYKQSCDLLSFCN
ncbi:MAG: M48 family metalloprotease [Bacteroidetes bacterium]|nr:M48 family metalloprotease [Bacteroidota bacterium]MDA1319264.1 M48 family metalloprotease [Bacteroidota bacterium]